MLILPAIDIRNGNCVRLYQGKADQETVYSHDPIQVALGWTKRGAKMLHVVDLDGAFAGAPVNLSLIAELRKQVQIPIEVGGGFRSIAAVRDAFAKGIDRVILGSAAVYTPEMVLQAVTEFGGKVTVSIDVLGLFAVVDGWKHESAVSFGELASGMRDLGVKELLFTDTRRDGTLMGPDLNTVRTYLKTAQLPVTISGGVTTLDDISNLKQLEPEGLKAVVIGKALYDHRILLEDALRVA